MKVDGQRLKEERRRRGLDLEEVARITRIRPPFLEAIEEGRLEDLPPGCVRKGFVESYARFLQIDPQEVMVRDGREGGDLPPLPFVKESKRGWVVLAALLAAGVAVATALYCLHRKVEQAREARIPPSRQTLSPASPPETPREERPSPKEHVLEIRATHLTWIEIRRGKAPPYDITLYPGERYRIADPEGFSLKVGNAGGVRISFDGKDLGKLGELGKVVKLTLPPKGPPRPSRQGPSP